MVRRPILLLALFLLGGAVVQAAVISLTDRDACGPIR
jgi:hypothetical protein